MRSLDDKPTIIIDGVAHIKETQWTCETGMNFTV
jgi:hypothetical protein